MTGDRTARQESVQIVIPDTARSMLGYFILTFKKLLLIFLSLPSCKITKIPSAQYSALVIQYKHSRRWACLS